MLITRIVCYILSYFISEQYLLKLHNGSSKKPLEECGRGQVTHDHSYTYTRTHFFIYISCNRVYEYVFEYMLKLRYDAMKIYQPSMVTSMWWYTKHFM